MPNMSYCRWENTANAMQDCVDTLSEMEENPSSFHDLSQSEQDGMLAAARLAFEMLKTMPLFVLCEADIKLYELPGQDDIDSAETPMPDDNVDDDVEEDA